MDTHSKERGKKIKKRGFTPLRLPLTGRKIEILQPTQNHLKVHVAG
jgi:hypothetical protein